MKIEACKNPSEVALRCADLLEEIVGAAPEPVLILPAGSTPLPLFTELVRRVGAGLDLRRAHVFQLDELVGVAPDHPRSFHRLLRDRLLDPIRHPAERTHLIDGTAPDPTAEIARQARELAECGGADLTVLGVGRNGHVAFNEPGSTLHSPARLLALQETTIQAMNGAFRAGEVPHEGVTLGLREIAASRALCILATGESKADILRALVTDAPSSARPASLLFSHPALTFLADAPARRHLTPAEPPR